MIVSGSRGGSSRVLSVAKTTQILWAQVFTYIELGGGWYWARQGGTS
jgi:hypothetical protein